MKFFIMFLYTHFSTQAGADLIGFLFVSFMLFLLHLLLFYDEINIFLIFIFGFIFMGWLSFGADMEEFNTFVHSFSTSWTFIIGNAPDYNAMFRSNRLLGPLVFIQIHTNKLLTTWN